MVEERKKKIARFYAAIDWIDFQLQNSRWHEYQRAAEMVYNFLSDFKWNGMREREKRERKRKKSMWILLTLCNDGFNCSNTFTPLDSSNKWRLIDLNSLNVYQYFLLPFHDAHKKCAVIIARIFSNEANFTVNSFPGESDTISGEIKIVIYDAWNLIYRKQQFRIQTICDWMQGKKNGIHTKVSCHKLLICGNEKVLLTINYLPPSWSWYRRMEFWTNHKSFTKILNSIKRENFNFPKKKKRNIFSYSLHDFILFIHQILATSINYRLKTFTAIIWKLND